MIDRPVNLLEGDPTDQEGFPRKDHENVIFLNKYENLASVEILEEIIKGLEEGSVRNFLVVSHVDNTKEEKEYWGTQTRLMYYFFGKDSCTTLVGVADRIKHIIHSYMDGEDVFGDGG